MSATDANLNGKPPQAQKAGGRKPNWNYQPPLPIQVSPIFRWPWEPVKIATWIVRGWLPISERLLIAGISVLTWLYTQPALERCKELAIDWIAQIYVRNLLLMVLVAGGLHLYFYVLRGQGDERRYDSRPLGKDHKLFTFQNQVRDNIFWTCASGVTIWTAYEASIMWAMANGYMSVLSWEQSPVWFLFLFFLIPMWETFYFYLIHRFLHWPPLYRLAHAVHHRNTNVGPWSGLSMHPIEHLLYLGSVLIHWVVIAHPVHILYHLQYFALSAATSHCGYEGVVARDRARLPLGTFHHQLHHRYFECNYGGLEIPWDRFFGSFHDGTPEAHDRLRDHMRRRRPQPR